MPNFTLLIGFLAAATLALMGYANLRSPAGPDIPDRPAFLPEPVTELGPLSHEQRKLVDEINRAHAGLHTLSARADLILRIRGKTVRLLAEASAEASRRSRFAFRSWFGLESEVGSTDAHYWSWFKRKDPDHIYQGAYEQSATAGFLNPVWLKEALGLQHLDAKGARIGRQGPYLVLVRPQGGRTRATALDPAAKRIVGNYLYQAEGQLLAFTEAKHFVSVSGCALPRVLAMGWPGEDTYIWWQVTDHRLNDPLDEQLWSVPAHGHIVTVP